MKAQQFYITSGQLTEPKYSYDELLSFQEGLSKKLEEINKALISENKQLQSIPEWGIAACAQQFWHQEIEKIGYRTRNGTKVKVKRIAWNALPDGVHAADHIVEGWYTRVHQCFKNDLIRIKSSPMASD